MKVRKGFVSNSSSTSYTCEICGGTESGWDSSPMEDFGFIECENEHTICMDCADITTTSLDDEIYTENNDDERTIKSELCPVCRFEVSSKNDLKRYLYKMYKVEDNEVLEEIKRINKRRKKVYDTDYVNYVYKKHNLQELDLLQEFRTKFGIYSELLKYIER